MKDVLAIENHAWNDAEFVTYYLAQTYYYVSHSERLLCYAMSKLEDRKQFKRFKEHLIEESSHDMLALRDLSRFGKSIDNIHESPLTKSFYMTQYYLIDSYGPMVLLGYILFLEELASQKGERVFNLIKKFHAVESSFLKLHFEEDEDHVKEAKKMIESLPHDLQAAIQSNYEDSRQLFHSILCERDSVNKMVAA